MRVNKFTSKHDRVGVFTFGDCTGKCLRHQTIVKNTMLRTHPERSHRERFLCTDDASLSRLVFHIIAAAPFRTIDVPVEPRFYSRSAPSSAERSFL